MEIIIIILIVLYLIILRTGDYSVKKGIEGEKKVKDLLEKFDQLRLLNNIILPNSLGNIDHIVLTRNGVYCIETKNYTGKINIYWKNWYKNGVLLKKSPTNQLITNTIILREFLSNNNINKSIVKKGVIVCTGNASIKIKASKVLIYTIDEFENNIFNIFFSNNNVSSKDLRLAYNELRKYEVI